MDASRAEVSQDRPESLGRGRRGRRLNLRILYRDERLVAVDKPAGFHVHPPEDDRHLISRSVNSLALLRRQLGTLVYPVHRLDRATSGVLLFALDSEAASAVGALFREKKVSKTYFAVTRGWAPEQGVIDTPLRSEHDADVMKDARTDFDRLASVEFPVAVGRYSSARYSLVRAIPHTGRLHQIRRHLARIAHPIVGDTIHGDGAHNRFWREKLGRQALLLHAQALELKHPFSGETLRIRARWNGVWHQVFDAFGICPY